MVKKKVNDILQNTRQVTIKKNFKSQKNKTQVKRMPSNAQLGTSELNIGKVLLWTKARLHLKCNTWLCHSHTAREQTLPNQQSVPALHLKTNKQNKIKNSWERVRLDKKPPQLQQVSLILIPNTFAVRGQNFSLWHHGQTWNSRKLLMKKQICNGHCMPQNVHLHVLAARLHWSNISRMLLLLKEKKGWNKS